MLLFQKTKLFCVFLLKKNCKFKKCHRHRFEEIWEYSKIGTDNVRTKNVATLIEKHELITWVEKPLRLPPNILSILFPNYAGILDP